MATGWDNGLCQDYCRGLSIWFASRLDARHTIRKHFMTQPNTQAHADVLAFYLRAAANYIDALGGDSKSYRAAIASQPAQAGAGVPDAAVQSLGDDLARKHAVYLTRESVREMLERALGTTPPQAQPATVAVDVVKAFQALYDAIDSCVELTPEVMLRARAALQSARCGQDVTKDDREWLEDYCRKPIDPDGEHLVRLRRFLGGQDGGDAGGEQVQRIDVQGVRVYGTPSAMVQDMPLIREVFGLAEDAQPAAVSAEGVGVDVARDAREALQSLLNNIRINAPQLSGKSMGFAEQVIARIDAAIAANKEGQSHE